MCAVAKRFPFPLGLFVRCCTISAALSGGSPQPQAILRGGWFGPPFAQTRFSTDTPNPTMGRCRGFNLGRSVKELEYHSGRTGSPFRVSLVPQQPQQLSMSAEVLPHNNSGHVFTVTRAALPQQDSRAMMISGSIGGRARCQLSQGTLTRATA